MFARVLLSVLLLAALCAAQAAPRIPATWSVEERAPKNLKWQARLGGAEYGGAPVVAEGKVFIGTNNRQPRDPRLKGPRGVLLCLDAKTGAFLWQITHEPLDQQKYPPRCGAGPGDTLASTPVVEDGKVYYISNRCELVCAETTKGTILWKLDMIADLGVYPGGMTGCLPGGNPLLLDDLILAPTTHGPNTRTGQVENPKAPSLVAVDKLTGKVVWQDAAPGADIPDGQWSSPTAARVDGTWQVIYGYGDGWLRGLNARTGKVLWQFDGNPPGLKFKFQSPYSKNYFVATPTVHAGRVYFAMGQGQEHGDGVGHLWCLALSKAGQEPTVVWQRGGQVLPRPAGMYRNIRFGRSVSAVLVHDGIAYAVELDGYLHAFDAGTGEKLWTEDFKDQSRASPYHVDGKITIGTEGGDVIVLAAGREKKLLARNKMEAPVRTPVVAVEGVLYVSDGAYLYAIAAHEGNLP